MQYELFYDSDYELECKNKIDYRNYFDSIILEKNTIDIPSSFETENYSSNIFLYKGNSTNTILAVGTAQEYISKFHIKKYDSGVYCYEIQISETAKKIILE